MEMAGFAPKLVVGSPPRFQGDLSTRFCIGRRFTGEQEMNIRVGGWDTHALVEGRPLMLGGFQIRSQKGLLGHSDADVLLHAITDALLGAAGLGDVGQHFPDTDATYKGADSAKLLKTAYAHVKQLGWHIGNVDCAIVARPPNWHRTAQTFGRPLPRPWAWPNRK
jgi:2-C-methyl-D-erythritol 2,4-cyclodiphosphate synthase